MACYAMWSDGVKVMSCGQCIGCKLERSRQWAVRCVHEARLHKSNCFILLTYKDAPFSLCHRDFQLFMKRLRKEVSPVVIRYFMCGEYGEPSVENGFVFRPHFHSVIFNYDFPDKVYFKKSPAGFNLYRSRILESCWSLGHASVAEFSFDAAAYVARYCTKKITCPNSEDMYEHINLETGEVFVRLPEYGRMSLRPGIGSGWYDRYWRDWYPDGKCVVKEKQMRAPSYYDKKFKAGGFVQKVQLCESRRFGMLKWVEDNSDVRLRAKDAVARAKLRLFKP